MKDFAPYVQEASETVKAASIAAAVEAERPLPYLTSPKTDKAALARALDREGIRYERRENCFAWIEDLARAQELMDQLLRTSWPDELGRFARLVNPAHSAIFGSYRAEYYWIGHETEWASDIMFRDAADLAALSAPLARHGVAILGSRDVLHFLGRKLTGSLRAEVTSHLKRRPEGIRVLHSVGRNSVKAYDKQGTVLRVETTINNTRDFKVSRTHRYVLTPKGRDTLIPIMATQNLTIQELKSAAA